MWPQSDAGHNHRHVCGCDIKTSPWQAIRLYRLAGVQLKQEGDLPDYLALLADGTARYEAEIRQAWEAYKLNPTTERANQFIEYLIELSGAMWPDVMAAVLGVGVEELTTDQHKVLQDALDEHHGYMRESLLPDVVRAGKEGRLDKLDYRTTVLYAGALWMFGGLATVMFDGLSVRDLADLFMFAGPNDDATCTGPRGCQSHANKIYTVAQILADDIIPGRMRCYTNCRHFLLPIASPLRGAEKHQMGRHDQRTHTPEKYRGQGISEAKPKPQVFISKRIQELIDPDSETNTQARDNWDNLSHSERMKLMDPKAVDTAMRVNLERYREEVDLPHTDLKGKLLTSDAYDQVAANTHARIDSLKGALSPVTEQLMRDYVDDYVRKAVDLGLKDKTLKMGAGQLDDMMAKNVDMLVHQEIESRKRQLGDHGIRHVVGNMRAITQMMDDPNFPPATGAQRMMALQTMAIHDMGMTAGVVSKTFVARGYHEEYSAKYAKDQGYDKLFGAGNAKELHRMVLEHASTDLDWDNDAVMSAVRVADNTALFNREKLPALFYDVPGATDELYKLQLAVVGGTAKEAISTTKENLRKLVTDSTIDDRQKSELMMAVDEVSPITGRFTLGMASGEIDGYKYSDGVMNIRVTGKPERELLSGLFDLGDKQFNKFVEGYDATGNLEQGYDLARGGKRLVHIDYKEPSHKDVSGTLATMYSNSIRPDINQAYRQVGPSSTLTDRERAWPMIQANVKGKLTAAELAEFERRFKNDTLDEMPLTERERSYLEAKLKEMLKHLPGHHDQRRHTPRAYRSQGTRLTREYFTKGHGKYLLDIDMDPGHKELCIKAMLQMGVTQEDVSGLGMITTMVGQGYRYDGNVMKDRDGQEVWGFYSPSQNTVHVSLELFETEYHQWDESLQRTLIHEIGHHKTMYSPPGDQPAWGRKTRRLGEATALAHFTGEAVGDRPGSDSFLTRAGLRRYSLTNGKEFLADSYKVARAGTTAQQDKLEQLWKSSGFLLSTDTLEDVFKGELIHVDEIVTLEDVEGNIGVMPRPVVVSVDVVEATPWYYVGVPQAKLKHLPGRHDQSTHNPYKGRAGADLNPLDYTDKSEYSRAKLGFTWSEKLVDGRWVSRGDELASDEEIRQITGAEQDWENELLKAVSRGEIKAERDYHNDVYLTGHAFNNTRVYLPEIMQAAEFGPMPTELYHVTTAKTAIVDDNDGLLKSRYDLSQGQARGLGGGSNNTISFTTDKAIAENIRDRMLEARQVARGELSFEELLHQAEEGNNAQQPWLRDWIKMETGRTDIHSVDDVPESMKLEGRGYEVYRTALGMTPSSLEKSKRSDAPISRDLAPKEGYGEWFPVGEGREAGGGERAYYEYARTRPEADTRQYTFNMYKSWLGFREHAGGPENPLFWGTDAEYLASIDTDEVAILKYRPKPGTVGVKKSALGEWRTWDGEGVELESVE